MQLHINIGSGVDCTIRKPAETVARVTGFKGKLTFDASKPAGTPRKLLNVSRLKSLGSKATILLEAGLVDAYSWTWRMNNGFGFHEGSPYFLSRSLEEQEYAQLSAMISKFGMEPGDAGSLHEK